MGNYTQIVYDEAFIEVWLKLKYVSFLELSLNQSGQGQGIEQGIMETCIQALLLIYQ